MKRDPLLLFLIGGGMFIVTGLLVQQRWGWAVINAVTFISLVSVRRARLAKEADQIAKKT